MHNIYQHKINKLKEIISRSIPEETMLTLARFGNAPKKQPDNSDFETVVSSINIAEPRIIFPWFWKHHDVFRFREQSISKIDQSKLVKIISDTCSILDFQNSHWIERVNLFHLFGVSRLFPIVDEKLVTLQEKTIRHVHSGLIGVSATNANLLAKDADVKDAIMVVKKLSDENLKKVFAEYQIYYYDGLDNLIRVLSNYIGTPKEVLIPPTVNSIVSCLNLRKEYTELLMDTLVSRLPPAGKRLSLE